MTADAQKNILLLDDDKFLVDMYGMKFTHEGYNVQTSLSAKDAIQVLKGGFEPDVIVFDIVMPECDGFQFLQMLKDEKLGVHAVKIALTNQNTDTERAKATELGAEQFVVKATMIPSEVVNTVASALSGRKNA